MWFMCILFVVSFLMFATVAVDVVHLHSIWGQLSYVSHCGSGCGQHGACWSVFSSWVMPEIKSFEQETNFAVRNFRHRNNESFQQKAFAYFIYIYTPTLLLVRHEGKYFNPRHNNSTFLICGEISQFFNIASVFYSPRTKYSPLFYIYLSLTFEVLFNLFFFLYSQYNGEFF